MPVLEVLVVRAGESEIEAIVAGARPDRRPSRGMWIAAAIVGAICLVAFVVVWCSDPAPVEQPKAAPPRSAGAGFASGLAIGIAAGIAIGFAIARRRAHSSGSGSEYSARSKP